MRASSNSKDDILRKAFILLCLFFAFLDYEGKSNHCDIIKVLYTSHNTRYTKVGVAQTVHICDRTLERYRARYVNCFLFYRNLLTEHAEAAIALDFLVPRGSGT